MAFWMPLLFFGKVVVADLIHARYIQISLLLFPVFTGVIVGLVSWGIYIALSELTANERQVALSGFLLIGTYAGAITAIIVRGSRYSA